MDILIVIFWIFLFALMHSYVFYPVILSILSRNKKSVFSIKKDSSFKVSILIAVYNEESVIEEKIESIIKGKFPQSKLEILIGSDASTDATNGIVKNLALKYACLQLFAFNERRGKASVINDLVEKATNEILILTDANIIFSKNTLEQLLLPFADEKVGLVDVHLKSINKEDKGVVSQEVAYNEWETKMKNMEGVLWGNMMGPSGACYALRKSLFKPIPANVLVDDFYVCMNVLKLGFKALSTLDAICFEMIQGDLKQEFRRKVRISTGNFQNLAYFANMAFRFQNHIAFSFWSHKILRWLGPFFIIGTSIAAYLLMHEQSIYYYYLLTQGIFFVLILSDLMLKPFKLKTGILRSITHFYLMNLALLLGFFKFLFGVKSGVWQPTKRINN